MPKANLGDNNKLSFDVLPPMNYLKDHLEKLNSFVIMTQKGSFRKAALSMKVSQPALSRQIAILEGVLETSLFHRTAKGVVLTPDGKTLRTFAEKLVEDAKKIEDRIRTPKMCTKKKLSIGTFDSISIRIFPSLMASLREEFPKLSIGVSTGDVVDLYETLKKSELDILLSEINEKLPQGLVAQKLFEGHYGVFKAPKFRISIKAGLLHLVDAINLPIASVDSARCATGQNLLRFLRNKGLSMSQVYQVETFEAAANYAREGVGLAVLPFLIAGPSLKEKKLELVKLDIFPSGRFGRHSMGLIYRRESEKDPFFKKFHEVLKAWFARES